MSRNAWAIVVGIGLLVALFVVGGLFLPYVGGRGLYGGMMGRGMMGGFGFGSPIMIMGGIGMIVFWALIIGAGIWLVQSLGRSSGGYGAHSPAPDSPLEILKRRYAKGEISKVQFEEMRRDLGA